MSNDFGARCCTCLTLAQAPAPLSIRCGAIFSGGSLSIQKMQPISRHNQTGQGMPVVSTVDVSAAVVGRCSQKIRTVPVLSMGCTHLGGTSTFCDAKAGFNLSKRYLCVDI